MKSTFHIKLSPQRRDDSLSLKKHGDTLFVNGQAVDLKIYDPHVSPCEWIIGTPERVEDGWNLQILLPHGHPAPHATRFPAPIDATDDGPIHLPPYTGPDEDAAALAAEIQGILARVKPAHMVPGKIDIPPRLCLSDLPAGVAFHETDTPFDLHPQYGAVVAHVIATASLLDLEMLRPAICLFGKDALLAIRTAFAALDRDEKKRRDYIRRLAEETGRELVWETIDWAFGYALPVIQLRNRFAHHIWGNCPMIPDTLLLADPMDRLKGNAALSQFSEYTRGPDTDAQALMAIATGEGGSHLSEADTKIIFEMALARQNDPARREAFDHVFRNPLDIKSPSAEVWTAQDFRNARLASNAARTHVVGRLQQISQWMLGLRAEDELAPLPPRPKKSRKR